MGILAWIVVGLIAGVLAKLIMPGDDPGGFIVTILLGIVGGLRRRVRGEPIRRSRGERVQPVVDTSGHPGGDHPASHLPASSRPKSLTDHSYSKGRGFALAFFMSS